MTNTRTLNKKATDQAAVHDSVLESMQGLFSWKPKYPSSANPRHLPLLFWLTQQIKPTLGVCLGVGDGTNHFTLCEATQALGQPAKIFGIERWGDTDGAVLPEIHGNLAAHAGAHHAELSRLSCVGPADATDHFDLGSVDLLLVDLDLTKDLLDQVVSVWAPLMSERSAIVLNRTACDTSEVVSEKLEKIRSRWPLFFEATGGNGMLVLLCGANPPSTLASLCNSNTDDPRRQHVLELFSWIGSTLADRQGNSAALTKVAQLETSLLEMKDLNHKLTTQLARRDAALAETKRQREDTEKMQRQLETTIERQREEMAFLTAQAEKAVHIDSSKPDTGSDVTQSVYQGDGQIVERQSMPSRVRSLLRLLRRSPKATSFREQLAALRQSDYFDSEWYAATYPECGGATKAAEHYLREGAFVGNDPSPKFSTLGYYQRNPDVADSDWSALGHYIFYGKSEGRIFDPVSSCDVD